MAFFTSKATGNWSASGQTTWNESGIPGFGDRVTINNSHVVTVDLNSIGGDGSDSAITILAGGTLTLADLVTLTVIGQIDNSGDIIEGDGSAIVFGLFTLSIVNIQVPPVVIRYPDAMVIS